MWVLYNNRRKRLRKCWTKMNYWESPLNLRYSKRKYCLVTFSITSSNIEELLRQIYIAMILSKCMKICYPYPLDGHTKETNHSSFHCSFIRFSNDALQMEIIKKRCSSPHNFFLRYLSYRIVPFEISQIEEKLWVLS